MQVDLVGTESTPAAYQDSLTQQRHLRYQSITRNVRKNSQTVGLFEKITELNKTLENLPLKIKRRPSQKPIFISQRSVFIEKPRETKQ